MARLLTARSDKKLHVISFNIYLLLLSRYIECSFNTRAVSAHIPSECFNPLTIKFMYQFSFKHIDMLSLSIATTQII